jgi:hypothetical protein
MQVNQSHVGQVVTFLYGAKGYGEGVLLFDIFEGMISPPQPKECDDHDH